MLPEELGDLRWVVAHGEAPPDELEHQIALFPLADTPEEPIERDAARGVAGERLEERALPARLVAELDAAEARLLPERRCARVVRLQRAPSAFLRTPPGPLDGVAARGGGGVEPLPRAEVVGMRGGRALECDERLGGVAVEEPGPAAEGDGVRLGANT